VAEHVVTARLRFADDGTFVGLDRVVKKSQELGTTSVAVTDALHRLWPELDNEGKAASNASLGVSRLTAAMTELKRNDALRQIALSAQELNAAKPESALLAIQMGLSGIADPAKRAQLAIALLGQQGAELAAEIVPAVVESEEALATFGETVGAITSAIQMLVAAFVLRKAIEDVKELIMEGVEFNSLLQMSRLGLGSLIDTFGQVYDSQGKLLTGTNAYNEALRVGADLQDKLKSRVLSTTFQYSELLDVMQRGMPYMMAAFQDKNGNVVSNDKLVDFVATFSQGAKVAGLDTNEIGVNIQRFLTGTADMRHARFAAQLLQMISPDKEQAKSTLEEWEKQGTALEHTMQLLSAFKQVGEDSLKTYQGALSNTKDAVQQLLGEGTQQLTETLAKALNDVTDSLFVVDKAGKRAFSPDLVEDIKNVADGIGAIVSATAGFIRMLEKISKTYHEINTGNEGVADPEQLAKDKENVAYLKRWYPAQYGPLERGGDPTGEAKEARHQIELLDQRIAKEQELVDKVSAHGRDIGKKFLQQTVGGASLQGFIDPSQQGQELINLSKEDPEQYLLVIKKIAAAAKDGTLTYREFAKALVEADREMNQFHVKGPKLKGDGDGVDSARMDFDRWMKQFEVKSEPVSDSLARTLQDIAAQREEALARLDKAHAKLGISATEFEKDRTLINKTFDNKAHTATDQAARGAIKAEDTVRSKYSFAADTGSEIAQALAKIKAQREAALAEQSDNRAKFGVLFDYDGAVTAVNNFYNNELKKARLKATDWVKEQIKKEGAEERQIQEQMDTAAQQASDDARIALITNAIDRELAAREAADQRDTDAQVQAIKDQVQQEVFTKEQGAALIQKREDALAQKKKIAEAQADVARRKQQAGTIEWIADLKQKVDESLPPIGAALEGAILSDLQTAQNAIDGFLQHLVDGQHNLGKDLEDLGKGLGKTWADVFSKMVMNATTGKQSIAQQWDEMKTAMSSGSSLDRALAGAGLGSVIGGAIGGKNNDGQIGGEILGAVGAIIAGPLGAAIGSVLGAIIGSFIKSGDSNFINVKLGNTNLADLRDGGTGVYAGGDAGHNSKISFGKDALGKDMFFEIDQQGLSADAFHDLTIQVQRKVKETMKSWSSLIQLFPDEIQKQLAGFDPEISLTGGVNGGKEIGDTSGMTQLSDFLNNKVPEAVFDAYKPALSKALGLEGVGQNAITAAFAYWGTLTGQELHDAVQTYVTTVVKFVDNKNKISRPFEVIKNDALTALNSNKELDPLRDLNTQIGMVVASLPKITDVDDQVAAMQKLNDLTDQFQQQMLQAIETIEQRAKDSFESLENLKEQAQLAGMTDQQKMDYYYQQMTLLRGQIASSHDSAVTSQLIQKLEGYAQSALSLAPDNATNRQNIIDIANDVEGVGAGAYSKEEDDVQHEQMTAAQALQAAGQKLLDAGDALNPSDPTTPGKDPNKPTPSPDPKDPNGNVGHVLYDPTVMTADGTAVVAAIGQLTELERQFIAGRDGTPIGFDPLLADLAKNHARAAEAAAVVGFNNTLEQHRRAIPSQTESIAGGASSSGSGSDIAAAMREAAAEMKKPRRVQLEIAGDGAAWMQRMGMQFVELTVEQIVTLHQTRPELFIPTS
jgi:hypothetical protein